MLFIFLSAGSEATESLMCIFSFISVCIGLIDSLGSSE